MKIRLVIALLIFWTAMSQAQSIKVTKSKGVETGRGEFPIQLIRANENEKVLFTAEQSWNKLKNHIVHIPADGKSYHEEFGVPFDKTYGYDFVDVNNRLFRFLLTKEKKTKKLYRSMVEYNTIGEIQGIYMIDSIEYKAYKDMPAVRMRYSQDSSYLLIVDAIDSDDKKKDYILRTTVMDKNLEIQHITEYKPTRKKSQKTTDLSSIAIGNNGTVYALHQVIGENGRLSKKHKNKSKSDPRKSIANYHFELTRITLDGKVTHDKIDHNHEFSNHESIFMADKDEPIIVLQINDTKEKDAVAIGLNVVTYDKAKNTLKSNPQIFSKSEWEKFGYESKRKNCGGLRKFGALNAQSVIINGELYFFSERIFYETDRNGTRRSFAEEAVIFSVNEQGDITNIINVPKFSMSFFNQTNSLLTKAGNKIALLYHDSKRNKDKDLKDYKSFSAKSMFKNKTRNMVCAVADQNGNVSRKVLKNTDDLLALPEHFISASNGSIYIPVLDTPSITSKGKIYVYNIKIED